MKYTYLHLLVFCYLNYSAPTRPPEDVLLTQVTSVSINVSWEAPPACCIHGVLSNYCISVSQNGAIIMLLTSMTKTLVISGLTPYTNYTISVAAHTIAGPGPYSEPLLVQTNEAGQSNKCKLILSLLS